MIVKVSRLVTMQKLLFVFMKDQVSSFMLPENLCEKMKTFVRSIVHWKVRAGMCAYIKKDHPFIPIKSRQVS